jgi:hypothetical protein
MLYFIGKEVEFRDYLIGKAITHEKQLVPNGG